jgi:hypothetical protein
LAVLRSIDQPAQLRDEDIRSVGLHLFIDERPR